jgi:hypothetical protein
MTKDPDITIWADTKGRLTVYIGGDSLHSTLSLSASAAERLAKELVDTVNKLPRIAEASDLGLVAA